MKKPWQSKTIIINSILGILAAIAAFVPQASGLAAWIQSNDLLIGGLWSVLAIGLRLVSKDSVQLRD